MKQKKNVIRKNDVILICAIGMTALLLFGIRHLITGTAGESVVVTVAGQEMGRYSLHKSVTVPIVGKNGTGKNILQIEDGYAKMTEADCPDKTCVHQKAISRMGETIICLPHQIVVSIESSQVSEVDEIAN